MRAPWTVLRDARAEIARESDERGELLRLRRARVELRTVAVVAVAGLVIMLWQPGVRESAVAGRIPLPLSLLTLTMVAWFIAHAAAKARHGGRVSPEAERADALWGLATVPASVLVAGFIYWYLGQDLQSVLIYLAFLAPAMAIGMYIRYRRTTRDVELAEERDEAETRVD